MVKYEDRANELSNAHWQFISDLLDAHRIDDYEIETARFHYLQAFRHGYKHAMEDVEAERLARNERDQLHG
jgi:hypothetical protein